jgi:hypothetical protein
LAPGDTTWFFEHFVLHTQQRGYEVVDDRYERVFNSYYYTVGAMHPRDGRGLLSRPTVTQIHDYRSRIDEAVHGLIEARPDDTELAALVELGLPTLARKRASLRSTTSVRGIASG